MQMENKMLCLYLTWTFDFLMQWDLKLKSIDHSESLNKNIYLLYMELQFNYEYFIFESCSNSHALFCQYVSAKLGPCLQSLYLCQTKREIVILPITKVQIWYHQML